MENRTGAGRQKRTPGKKRKSPVGRIIIGFFLVSLVMLLGIGCGFLTASLNTKPDLVHDITPPASSHIYDVNGNEIANIHATENRMPVKLAQVPNNLRNAFVAVEDNRFYEHSGVDPRGIARAMWANIQGNEVSEGGSTITQQLAKNAYLTQDRTYKRKIQEMFLALQLERQYTKDEILELYLNQIYFGQGAYGVQAAAQTYFGKNVEDLDLNECAMLAGIPKSPNYYSPFNNMQAAQERKEIVLDQMQKYGYLSSADAAKTKKQELNLVKPKTQAETQQAAYFIDYVTQRMIEEFGADAVYKNGLKIYTTLDMDMQKAAEEALKLLPDYEADGNGIMQPQGAIVAIDPHNGHVKAMVGGRGTDQFNRATMAERQPGSAFKPFVFVAALESNYTPDTVINDSPVRIGDWEPQNDSGHFSGKVTLRTVAQYSMNVPTVKLAQKLGMDKPIYYAQEMGITTFVLDGPTNDRNLATALGGLTKGVTPMELTSAYGTFANRGVHVEPVCVTKVLDRNGKDIYHAEPQQRSVVSENSAAQLTSMLQTVVQKGTGTRAQIGRPAAGKTGTTDNNHDAWFVGYTPDLVAGVWVGNDDSSSLHGMMGGQTPAEIWSAFMSKALATTPVKEFDGAGWTEGAIGELEDDKNTSVGNRSGGDREQQSNSTAAPPQPAGNDNTAAAPARNESRRESNERRREESTEPEPRTPANVQTEPEPAAEPEPVSPREAPTPGGSVGKGR